MLRVAFNIAIGALVILTSHAAMAMGFGKSSTRTTLGQPLEFSAAFSMDADEPVPPPRCVFADVWSGDAKLSSDKVRVVLEPSTDNSRRRVRVSTLVPIDEPVASIELTVGCGSQISRRFVSFIDPAPVRLAERVDSGSPVSAPVDAQTAALTDLARSADRSRRGSVARSGVVAQDSIASTARGARRAQARRPSPRRASTLHVAAANAAPGSQKRARTTRQSARHAVVARAPARSGPRLRLDAPVAAATTASAPAALLASRAASASQVAAAPAPIVAEPSASAAADESAAIAVKREQDRIQVLEAGLARLRNESKAVLDTVGALRVRLQQAESDRYSNGLVYTLAGSTLFFLLLAVAFWLLRPRQRRRARWFDQQAASRRGRVRIAPTPVEPAPIRAPAQASDLAPLDAYASSSETRPAAYAASGYASVTGRDSVLEPTTIGGLEVTTVLGPEASRSYGESAEDAVGCDADAPTIEALIDLEQQAEFFIVLGQDDAAVALLQNHVRSSTYASPLPYLKLLELQQRRGDRRAYAQIRDEFNERFNALAPDWSADLQSGRSLEAYETTMARLQSLWPTPMQAMQALDALLFRRDASAETFDFPAYRELLFLYGVAGELSGPVETEAGAVDLFLPLEDAPASGFVALPIEARDFSVDLDVSQWPDAASADDLVIVRSAGRRGAG